MSRFIILVERTDAIVLPIIHGEGDIEGALCVYPTQEAAEAAAENIMACRAWGHTIIDLDDLP